MKQYLDLLKDVLENGVEKGDRTGTGTLSVFGRQMRFNLQDGFPLVTTKKVHLRSIIHELLWFLMGDTNIKYLNDNGVTIWDEWALKEDETIGYTMDNAERVRYAIHHQLYDGSLRDLTQYLNSLGNDELGHAYLDSIGVPKDITHVTKHKGSLGPVYGKQWVDWVNTKGEHINQIKKVIDLLTSDPDSRRIYVSAINVGELKEMHLEPCHNYFQFGTRLLNVNQRIRYAKEHLAEEWESFKESQHAAQSMNDEWITDAEWVENNTPERGLNCYFQLRSNDLFLGCPFNIASYALLTHMVAQQVGMVPLELVYSGVDAHIYNNHMEQVKLQLTRDPLPLPKLVINRKPASIFDYKFEDFELKDYESHPTIKAPVAI